VTGLGSKLSRGSRSNQRRHEFSGTWFKIAIQLSLRSIAQNRVDSHEKAGDEHLMSLRLGSESGVPWISGGCSKGNRSRATERSDASRVPPGRNMPSIPGNEHENRTDQAGSEGLGAKDGTHPLRRHEEQGRAGKFLQAHRQMNSLQRFALVLFRRTMEQSTATINGLSSQGSRRDRLYKDGCRCAHEEVLRRIPGVGGRDLSRMVTQSAAFIGNRTLVAFFCALAVVVGLMNLSIL